MTIEIICPIYNGANYIESLDAAIKGQKNVKISKISYILTEGKDNSEQLLKSIGANYTTIKLEEFSHSLTRENIAIKSESDILVFITQDIDIRDREWLSKLVEPIVSGEASAAFSRQLTKYNNIEKYTREKNYPAESYIVDKSSIEEMGIRAFFFSDASSAIDTKVFKRLNGYDGKILPTNEDQYIAYKLLMNGYKIKYCAESTVYHSHNFTLKQLYKRYYDVGKLYKQERYMDEFGTNKTGGNLAAYILKRAIQDKNIKVLIRFLPDMAARFLGMKMGKIHG